MRAENFLRVAPLAPSLHHASSEAFYAATLGVGVCLGKRSMADSEGYDLEVLCRAFASMDPTPFLVGGARLEPS